jgi:hypothetical protein
MSNEQATTQYTANPVANPEQFEFFAFVVENEVAVIIPIMKSIGSDLLIAAWSSDPKIMKLKDDEKNSVQQGFNVDAHGRFTQAPQ